MPHLTDQTSGFQPVLQRHFGKENLRKLKLKIYDGFSMNKSSIRLIYRLSIGSVLSSHENLFLRVFLIFFSLVSLKFLSKFFFRVFLKPSLKSVFQFVNFTGSGFITFSGRLLINSDVFMTEVTLLYALIVHLE